MLPPMPELSPACKVSLLTLPGKAFSSPWQSVSGHQRKGEASLRFGDVHGTRALVRPEESEGGSSSSLVQHSCLKKSHKDGRTKICVVVATGINGKSGSGHGSPHGRLNMRKNDIPWRVMLQENRYLSRWADCYFMLMAWLNEATWPAVVEVAVLFLMRGQTGDHRGPDTILRILRAWVNSLLFAP